jgi:CheY-like chemotaxis protein
MGLKNTKSDPSNVLLMAEDDPDDRLLSQVAVDEAQLAIDLRFVEDGEDLMNYLRGQGKYAGPSQAPRPQLILLDLNMPRKDGREALQEIKSEPGLRSIPVVVLTTSRDEQDIQRSYELGVSGYVTKPYSLGGLTHVMEMIGKYWFEVVELPPA